MWRFSVAVALLAAVSVAAAPLGAQAPGARALGIGRDATAAEIAAEDGAIGPDGAGLPPGHGSVAEGKAVFASHCAACHALGGGGPALAGPVLGGGAGSLATAHPLRTVGSYWPYATTLFDYVRRAMPFNAPHSLQDGEVYAVTAYLLQVNGIVPEDAVLDAGNLAAVRMPNRDGFKPVWPNHG